MIDVVGDVLASVAPVGAYLRTRLVWQRDRFLPQGVALVDGSRLTSGDQVIAARGGRSANNSGRARTSVDVEVEVVGPGVVGQIDGGGRRCGVVVAREPARGGCCRSLRCIGHRVGYQDPELRRRKRSCLCR